MNNKSNNINMKTNIANWRNDILINENIIKWRRNNEWQILLMK
jgi:hypothetical protein